MLYSKPVVASDVRGSGMGWVVDDRKNGILVPPADEAKLAGALQALAEDRALAEEMGKKGREKFDRLFHIEQVAEKVQRIYWELSKR